jgi:hypothetical protein
MSIPGPLKALLLSRKVWLGVIAVVGAFVLFAQDAITAEQLVNSIVALVGVIIAAIAYEDGATKGNPGSQTNLNVPDATTVTVNQPSAELISHSED